MNVLGTCSMPFGIMIVNFSEKYKKDASYEPELHPGVTYKLYSPKATLKIFSTGSITVTGRCIESGLGSGWGMGHRFRGVIELSCIRLH